MPPARSPPTPGMTASCVQRSGASDMHGRSEVHRGGRGGDGHNKWKGRRQENGRLEAGALKGTGRCPRPPEAVKLRRAFRERTHLPFGTSRSVTTACSAAQLSAA
eukprot:365744-Chlamydomonas_euryale.AAC.5